MSGKQAEKARAKKAQRRKKQVAERKREVARRASLPASAGVELDDFEDVVLGPEDYLPSGKVKASAALLYLAAPFVQMTATREPVAAPVRAAAAPRVARVGEAKSLAALCDVLVEGKHRAFVLRHHAAGCVGVVGDAPRGRWSLPGPDPREGDLDTLAGLPRRTPLLCLARDRSPWAALQTAYGDERVSLVYPLPPEGVDLSLDGEVGSRLPALLQPHPRAAFTPWNELPTESVERRLLVGADGVAWAQYAAQVAVLVRAQGERLHASDVASLALEQARRGARAPPPKVPERARRVDARAAGVRAVDAGIVRRGKAPSLQKAGAFLPREAGDASGRAWRATPRRGG